MRISGGRTFISHLHLLPAFLLFTPLSILQSKSRLPRNDKAYDMGRCVKGRRNCRFHSRKQRFRRFACEERIVFNVLGSAPCAASDSYGLKPMNGLRLRCIFYSYSYLFRLESTPKNYPEPCLPYQNEASLFEMLFLRAISLWNPLTELNPADILLERLETVTHAIALRLVTGPCHIGLFCGWLPLHFCIQKFVYFLLIHLIFSLSFSLSVERRVGFFRL